MLDPFTKHMDPKDPFMFFFLIISNLQNFARILYSILHILSPRLINF